jgi:hypothetical protein
MVFCSSTHYFEKWVFRTSLKIKEKIQIHNTRYIIMVFQNNNL